MRRLYIISSVEVKQPVFLSRTFCFVYTWTLSGLICLFVYCIVYSRWSIWGNICGLPSRVTCISSRRTHMFVSLSAGVKTRGRTCVRTGDRAFRYASSTTRSYRSSCSSCRWPSWLWPTWSSSTSCGSTGRPERAPPWRSLAAPFPVSRRPRAWSTPSHRSKWRRR